MSPLEFRQWAKASRAPLSWQPIISIPASSPRFVHFLHDTLSFTLLSQNTLRYLSVSPNSWLTRIPCWPSESRSSGYSKSRRQTQTKPKRGETWWTLPSPKMAKEINNTQTRSVSFHPFAQMAWPLVYGTWFLLSWVNELRPSGRANWPFKQRLCHKCKLFPFILIPFHTCTVWIPTMPLFFFSIRPYTALYSFLYKVHDFVYRNIPLESYLLNFIPLKWLQCSQKTHKHGCKPLTLEEKYKIQKLHRELNLLLNSVYFMLRLGLTI